MSICWYVFMSNLHTQTHKRLSAWVDWYQKDKPFWILLKQKVMGWQWHQLNHMQIICTSLQTDNHASTSSLHIFYRPDALPATQPTASKHWRTIMCDLMLIIHCQADGVVIKLPYCHGILIICLFNVWTVVTVIKAWNVDSCNALLWLSLSISNIYR